MNDFQREEQQLKRLQLSIAERELFDKLNSAILTNMPEGKVAIDDISEALGVHTSKLRRQVKSNTGLTLTLYILHIRLREALKMLKRYPQYSITAIAAECGFADHSHFTHVFHRVFGIAPLQYFNEHYNSTAKQQ